MTLRKKGPGGVSPWAALLFYDTFYDTFYKTLEKGAGMSTASKPLGRPEGLVRARLARMLCDTFRCLRATKPRLVAILSQYGDVNLDV